LQGNVLPKARDPTPFLLSAHEVAENFPIQRPTTKATSGIIPGDRWRRTRLASDAFDVDRLSIFPLLDLVGFVHARKNITIFIYHISRDVQSRCSAWKKLSYFLNHTREIAKSVELLNRDLARPVAIEGSERL
jgi:hypothetical protein